MSMRRLMIALLVIAAGAALNVLVSLGLALWAPIDFRSIDEPVSQQAEWPRFLKSAGWPPPEKVSRIDKGFGMEILDITGPDRQGPTATTTPIGTLGCNVYRFGWPLRSMQRYVPWVMGSPNAIARMNTLPPSTHWYLGSATPTYIPIRGASRPLPLIPHALGTVANTGAYALLCYLLGLGVLKLRATIRSARGRCIRCGYRVGTSDTCSECGLPTRRACSQERSVA